MFRKVGISITLKFEIGKWWYKIVITPGVLSTITLLEIFGKGKEVIRCCLH
jgi:hypothetical protein